MTWVDYVVGPDDCWLCGDTGPTTTIITEAEYPNGPYCPPKEVKVHFGCYMDMEG